MDSEQILDAICGALDDHLHNDEGLFKYASREETHSHRIAHYLENRLINFLANLDISVDCEYDKHGEEQKAVPDLLRQYPENATDIVRPDIVIHHRGVDSSNVLVVEIKRFGHTVHDKQYAKDKIQALMAGYYYQYGLYVELNNSTEYSLCLFYQWKNGLICSSRVEI